MAKQKLIEEKQLYLGLESAAKRIRERISAIPSLRDNQLGLEQWLILEQVGKYPGIHQKRIIDKLNKEPASVSRMVKKLIQKELLYRQKNEENKKIAELFLTNKAEQLYIQAKKDVDSEFKEIFSSFYERELNLLIDILKRI